MRRVRRARFPAASVAVRLTKRRRRDTRVTFTFRAPAARRLMTTRFPAFTFTVAGSDSRNRTISAR